jgi:hypothetical protein
VNRDHESLRWIVLMSQSRTSGGVGVSEARRLDALSWQFPPTERPGPRRPSGLDLISPEDRPTDTRRRPQPEYTYAAPEPAVEHLPVQAVVDRSDLLQPMMVDIEVIANGTVIQILRYPEFGPYGRDVNDPAWFSDRVSPRTAICGVLAPYAAARCLAGAALW